MKDKCNKCHPDHSNEIVRINRLQGQLEGIKNMIVSRRYCPDILLQTKAVLSALRSLEASILEKHIQHCVKHTFESGNKKEIENKTKELIKLYKR